MTKDKEAPPIGLGLIHRPKATTTVHVGVYSGVEDRWFPRTLCNNEIGENWIAGGAKGWLCRSCQSRAEFVGEVLRWWQPDKFSVSQKN